MTDLPDWSASGGPDTFTLRAWPAQAELAGWLQETGWAGVEWRNLTGGVVALHRGTRA